MNPFTGRPEWEPEPAVLAEIERSTQEVEKRESRNPIFRFCGLCLILGFLGVGVLSLSPPPVANSRHAQPVVSSPSRIKHRARHSGRAHPSKVGASINTQSAVPRPTK